MQPNDTTLLSYRIAFASIRSMGYDLAQKILDIIPSEQDFLWYLRKRVAKSTSHQCEDDRICLSSRVTRKGSKGM